jgi:4'-phosphopantetheinyl transferase
VGRHTGDPSYQFEAVMTMASCGLDIHTVRVRWLPIDREILAHLPRWRAMLDSEEVARADRLHFSEDRNTFIAAHALARAMLSEVDGLPTVTWHYITGPFGKPAIAPGCGDRGLSFNISHTRGLAACAVTCEDPVGLDVEASDRLTALDIASRYFAADELNTILDAEPEKRRGLFFRFWTLKEAFIKATGEGLSRPLDSFAFSLDPIRIAFHTQPPTVTRGNDPTDWQFVECNPQPHRQLALALCRPRSRPMRLDARAMRPEEVAPIIATRPDHVSLDDNLK